MGYVIAAIIVLLGVGGFVLFLVRNATAKSNVSDAEDPGADQNALGIVGSDDASPAGSTSQHAPSDEGGRFERVRDEDRPDVAPPVVGGEGEGERSTR
jgi:hypothetical protein